MSGAGKAPTDRLFFAAGALYAALAVPAWTLTWTGDVPLWPVTAGPAAHGHEMTLGFAGAMLAGFLFTRLDRLRLALILGLWLTARLAVVLAAPPAVQAVVLLAHPLALALYGGWPFLRAAKTLHNAVPGLALVAFLGAEALYIAGLLGLEGGQGAAAMMGLGLVALMLFAMGGRLIPAATAGALRKAGATLPMARRLQRRAEAVGVAALGAMAVTDALAALRLAPPELPALGAALAGGAALLRLTRWLHPAIARDAALWPLHLGYGWLGVGLGLKALAQFGLLLSPQTALHGIAVGALGTLAATVAWRTLRQRRSRPLMPARLPVGAAALIATATLLRLAGAHDPLTLTAAAGAWSVAWALLAVSLSRP